VLDDIDTLAQALAKLPSQVLFGVAVIWRHPSGIHAALERLGASGPVKELRRDAQSTNLVTSSPCVTNLVNLALQFSLPTHQRMPNAARALAEPG
jgi:hypothetical protein